jgi:hypothetical protein
VTRVANENAFAPLVLVVTDFHVHLGDQGTNRIKHPELAASGLFPNPFSNAVGAENHRSIVRDFVEFIDKDCALLPKAVDNVFVVYDFVTDKHRSAEQFQRAFDNADGAVNAGAEASGVSEMDFHVCCP